MVSIVVADDHKIVREGLIRLLEAREDFTVIGEAANGEEAVQLVMERRPDLVLMDIVMPGLDGLSALRTIKSMHPTMEVAMVSSVSGDAQKAEEAFRLGACQVLGKPFDREIIEALVENVRTALMDRECESGDDGEAD